MNGETLDEEGIEVLAQRGSRLFSRRIGAAITGFLDALKSIVAGEGSVEEALGKLYEVNLLEQYLSYKLGEGIELFEYLLEINKLGLQLCDAGESDSKQKIETAIKALEKSIREEKRVRAELSNLYDEGGMSEWMREE